MLKKVEKLQRRPQKYKELNEHLKHGNITIKREGEKVKKTLDKIIAKHNKSCALAQKTFKKKKQLHKQYKNSLKMNRVLKEKFLHEKINHKEPYNFNIYAEETQHA